MGKPVPPLGQPGDAADDRLWVEIVSLQRELGEVLLDCADGEAWLAALARRAG